MLRVPGKTFAPLLLVLAAGSCSTEPGPPPPRLVILYAACSVNKDFLAPYDSAVSFTPNFDRFGQESQVWTKHVTEAGQSGISFASLFSGVHAHKHGAYRHPVPLPETLYQISEAFRDGGYETFFWSGQRMGSTELGYGQGVPPENSFVRRPADGWETYTANDAQFAAVLQMLKNKPESKAFAQINLTLSHSPYHIYADGETIGKFLQRYPSEYPRGITDDDVNRLIGYYAENRLPLQWNYDETVEQTGLSAEDQAKLRKVLEMVYKACIWQLDGYFGQLLQSIEEAGLLDESLIVFTADHGEILYRENALFKWTHGLQQVPEVLNVPMIVRGPSLGVQPGRYEHVTRSIDVLPTMAGLCGIDLPEDAPVEGADLSEAILGREDPPELLAYSHTTTLGQNLLELFKDWTQVITLNPREDPNLVWARVRKGDMVYKLRNLGDEEWGVEAFDLARDPGEADDIFDPGNEEHREMANRVRAYKRLLVEGYANSILSFGHSATPEDLERLKALGYVGDDEELEASQAPPSGAAQPEDGNDGR